MLNAVGDALHQVCSMVMGSDEAYMVEHDIETMKAVLSAKNERQRLPRD